MQQLVCFANISVDGYFAASDGDISWAHKDKLDEEWNAFVEGNASGGETLVFGRVTYDMMAGYWPTPFAKANDPVVADRMNAMRKIVFSRTLSGVTWRNTVVMKDDLVATIRKLKLEPGEKMAILGSGSIVSQLLQEGLIDEIQLVVNPVVLGSGRQLFADLRGKLNLRLLSSRTFGNGNVLIRYAPTS